MQKAVERPTSLSGRKALGHEGCWEHGCRAEMSETPPLSCLVGSRDRAQGLLLTDTGEVGAGGENGFKGTHLFKWGGQPLQVRFPRTQEHRPHFLKSQRRT